MSRNSAEVVDGRALELLKAVAQAWHAHSGNPKPADEFRARKNRSVRRPSRFKLEAMEMAAARLPGRDNDDAAVAAERSWDFSMSLWDSYEIVTLSKKLEASMALDHPMQNPPGYSGRRGKRSRESKNSLRSLFNRSASSSSSNRYS